jgi:hypothetical protein
LAEHAEVTLHLHALIPCWQLLCLHIAATATAYSRYGWIDCTSFYLKMLLPCGATRHAGVLVAAAPVGAAVGAVALTLDGRSMPRRDRRRATRHVPRKPKTAASPAAAAEISAVEHDSTVLTAAAATAAAPAGAAEPELAASSGSEELVSAVVEVDSAADSPAKAAPAPSPAPAASAFAAAAGTAVEPDPAVLLPELVRCASPEAPSSTVEAAASTEDSIPQPGTPGSDIDAAAFDGAVTAGLPPLAVKPKGKDQKPVSSTKALKKGLSKSFKSVKKAFSMNSTGSSSLRSSLDIVSPNASITTPSNARPPLPTSGAAAFLRRSFSRDSRDVAVVADKDGSLVVQPSEGSATLRKMREALRRSFTISTPRSGSRRASVDSAF